MVMTFLDADMTEVQRYGSWGMLPMTLWLQ